jgi:hypothetical protein
MAAILRVVVERPVEVGRHNTDEVGTELIIIQRALYLAHALGVSVAFVRRMGWSKVEPVLGNRVAGYLIRVDASAKTTDKPPDLVLMRQPYDIAVNRQVLLPESDLVMHVCVKPSYLGGQMDYKGRFDSLKEGSS